MVFHLILWHGWWFSMQRTELGWHQRIAGWARVQDSLAEAYSSCPAANCSQQFYQAVYQAHKGSSSMLQLPVCSAIFVCCRPGNTSETEDEGCLLSIPSRGVSTDKNTSCAAFSKGPPDLSHLPDGPQCMWVRAMKWPNAPKLYSCGGHNIASVFSSPAQA